MTNSEIAHLVVGAFAGGILLALGVVIGAVADRIRGRGATVPRYRASKAAGAHPVREIVKLAHGTDIATDASSRMAADVQRALVTAGYDKATAQIAVAACAGSERATLEAWTRAALRQAMKQGAAS